MSDVDYILDASALMAVLNNEPGAESVKAVIGRASIGAVNLSEVVAKLQERSFSDTDVDDSLADIDLPVISFDEVLAMAAGRLRGPTRGHGLSFGDRACLALGLRLGTTVLTADRAWGELDLGVTIELIR